MVLNAIANPPQFNQNARSGAVTSAFNSLLASQQQKQNMMIQLAQLAQQQQQQQQRNQFLGGLSQILGAGSQRMQQTMGAPTGATPPFVDPNTLPQDQTGMTPAPLQGQPMAQPQPMANGINKLLQAAQFSMQSGFFDEANQLMGMAQKAQKIQEMEQEGIDKKMVIDNNFLLSIFDNDKLRNEMFDRVIPTLYDPGRREIYQTIRDVANQGPEGKQEAFRFMSEADANFADVVGVKRAGQFSNPIAGKNGVTMIDKRTGQVEFMPYPEGFEPKESGRFSDDYIRLQREKLNLQKEAQELKAEREERLAEKQKFETKLKSETTIASAEKRARDEYNSFKEPLLKIEEATAKVLSAVDSPVGDVTLVTSYLKVIDPPSVARESEVAAIENARSVIESIEVALKKAGTGEKLSEDQRAQIKEQAQIIRDVTSAIYQREMQNVLNIAGRTTINGQPLNTQNISGLPEGVPFGAQPVPGEQDVYILELPNGEAMRYRFQPEQ